MNCQQCSQRIEFRSGVKMFCKCEYLDRYMEMDNEDPIKGCPYKKKRGKLCKK